MTAAVILAAGVGSRLRPLTDDRPKALVAVGATSLLERMLESCAAAGLERAVIVTGYRAEAIDDLVRSRDLPLRVTTVLNPEYVTIQNAHSLYVAREALAGEGFVKLDGDILLPDGALLSRLLAHPRGSAALIDTSAIERGRALDAEAMKASVAGDLVTGFGKSLPLAAAAGESIGIEKVAADDADGLFEAIEQVVHREGNHHAYYEDVYHRMIAGGFAMGFCETAGLPWAEIDDLDDLERARALLGRG